MTDDLFTPKTVVGVTWEMRGADVIFTDPNAAISADASVRRGTRIGSSERRRVLWIFGKSFPIGRWTKRTVVW